MKNIRVQLYISLCNNVRNYIRNNIFTNPPHHIAYMLPEDIIELQVNNNIFLNIYLEI